MPPLRAETCTEAPTVLSDDIRAEKTLSAEPLVGKRAARVLYLFAGAKRKGSLANFLEKSCKLSNVDFILEEIDVLRGGRRHNILKSSTRQRLLANITGESTMLSWHPPRAALFPGHGAPEDEVRHL